MTLVNNIRDLRESKLLSQKTVREACGMTYATFVRIETGAGKTTQEEVDGVLKVLNKMKPGARKLGGRPFADPARQAAIVKAREEGKSVAEVVAGQPLVEDLIGTPAKKRAPRPARSRARKSA